MFCRNVEMSILWLEESRIFTWEFLESKRVVFNNQNEYSGVNLLSMNIHVAAVFILLKGC